MIEKIQHATASSPEGAKGLVKGVLACAFQNMAFMLPTGLLYLLVKDLLAGSTSGRSTFYLLGCVACFALILLTTWFQYNGTYFTTYKESGTRRLTLAERLRKLPLSFFGKRDLADLTSTIMADCEVLEKDCSHFIPGLFGSLISTALIALSLVAFEWRMALAALWVIPVSAAIVVGSYWAQDRAAFRQLAGQTARSLWAASLPLILQICVESDRFLPTIYGPGYEMAATAQRLLTPCLATAFLHNLAAYAMIGMRKHTLLLFFYLSGLVVNIVCCLTIIEPMPLEGAALSLTATKVWVAILTVGYFQWVARPMSLGQWLLMLAAIAVAVGLWWALGMILALPREVAELAGLLPLLALFWYWRPPPAFEKEQRQAA